MFQMFPTVSFSSGGKLTRQDSLPGDFPASFHNALSSSLLSSIVSFSREYSHVATNDLSSRWTPPSLFFSFLFFLSSSREGSTLNPALFCSFRGGVVSEFLASAIRIDREQIDGERCTHAKTRGEFRCCAVEKFRQTIRL